jgi:hypothetical protein
MARSNIRAFYAFSVKVVMSTTEDLGQTVPATRIYEAKDQTRLDSIIYVATTFFCPWVVALCCTQNLTTITELNRRHILRMCPRWNEKVVAMQSSQASRNPHFPLSPPQMI